MNRDSQNIYKEEVLTSSIALVDERLVELIKKTGQTYLDELVMYLSEMSSCKYAIVGVYDEGEINLDVQSFFADGKYITDFNYRVEGTPCERVKAKGLCVFPKDIQKLFPENDDLKSLSIEGYIGFPLFDLERNPVGLIVLMSDEPLEVTEAIIPLLEVLESKTELELERLKLKERLVFSRQEYKDVFNNFQDVFFMVYYSDKNEQIDIILSPSVNKLLGYELEEIKGLTFTSLFTKDVERDLFLQKVKNERQIKSQLLMFSKKDGEKLYVEIDCELISRDLLRGAAFGVRGIIKDVTKKYKEKLRTEIAFLIAQKSERRLTNVKSLVEFIRNSLMNVIDVSNFYIAIHEADKNVLYIPVIYDDEISLIGKETRIPFENSLTEYIIASKKTITKDKIALRKLVDKKDLKLRGKLPECFVGVPLKSEGKCFGAMVMQTYKSGEHYSKEDIDLFHFVATQVSYIVERTLWQETLIKKEEHYRSLIENSSEIFGIVNEHGIIEYMSESTKKITGFYPSNFIGKEIRSFIPLDSFIDSIAARSVDFKNHVEVINILNKRGQKKYLEVSLSSKNRRFVFNAKDVTKRIIADKKRDASYRQIEDLRHALNYTAAIYYTDCSNYQIIDVNEKLEKLSGYKKGELIGASQNIFNYKNSFVREREIIAKKINSGQVWQGEMNYKKKDGSLYWVYETVALVAGEENGADHFITIQYDITEEKKLKRNSIREVIEAQEHERERFAMEIHDGLGQVLLAAKMNLNVLKDSSEGLDQDSKNILNTSVELLTDAVQEARGISHGLMSRVLSRFGLAHAVDEIIRNINTSTKIQFDFKHNITDGRFAEEIEMGLYRTLQELTKNIIKHSKASRANLLIDKDGDDLLIEISDNGIGIAEGTIMNPKSGGIGLRNMRSRIEYLGGEFRIEDKIKNGTLIRIRITL